MQRLVMSFMGYAFVVEMSLIYRDTSLLSNGDIKLDEPE
jgi:hypothetical protein